MASTLVEYGIENSNGGGSPLFVADTWDAAVKEIKRLAPRVTYNRENLYFDGSAETRSQGPSNQGVRYRLSLIKRIKAV